MFAKMCVLLLV